MLLLVEDANCLAGGGCGERVLIDPSAVLAVVVVLVVPFRAADTTTGFIISIS